MGTGLFLFPFHTPPFPLLASAASLGFSPPPPHCQLPRCTGTSHMTPHPTSKPRHHEAHIKPHPVACVAVELAVSSGTSCGVRRPLYDQSVRHQAKTPLRFHLYAQHHTTRAQDKALEPSPTPQSQVLRVTGGPRQPPKAYSF